jgi:hypothetical protein
MYNFAPIKYCIPTPLISTNMPQNINHSSAHPKQQIYLNNLQYCTFCICPTYQHSLWFLLKNVQYTPPSQIWHPMQWPLDEKIE